LVRARRPFFVNGGSGRECASQGSRQEAGGDLAPLALEAARSAQTRVFPIPNPMLTTVAGCITGSQPDNPLF
jgi:hypothetical protein